MNDCVRQPYIGFRRNNIMHIIEKYERNNYGNVPTVPFTAVTMRHASTCMLHECEWYSYQNLRRNYSIYSSFNKNLRSPSGQNSTFIHFFSCTSLPYKIYLCKILYCTVRILFVKRGTKILFYVYLNRFLKLYLFSRVREK